MTAPWPERAGVNSILSPARTTVLNWASRPFMLICDSTPGSPRRNSRWPLRVKLRFAPVLPIMSP